MNYSKGYFLHLIGNKIFMGDHPDFPPVNIIYNVISERHYMRNGDNILLKQDTFCYYNECSITFLLVSQFRSGREIDDGWKTMRIPEEALRCLKEQRQTLWGYWKIVC